MVSAANESQPFVGRVQEMSRLGRLLDAALAGSGAVVMLTGEAGIGKTRTAKELLALAGRAGADGFIGRCRESGATTPAFWPWSEALGGYVATLDDDTLRADLADATADVASIVAAVGERLRLTANALPSEAAAASDQARFRQCDRFASWLLRAARRRPMVVLLDDLHWADAASLALLEFVGRVADRGALLLIGTYRDHEVAPGTPLAALRASLRRETSHHREVLGALSDEAVVELLEANGISAALAPKVQHYAEGNPFFLGEIMHELRQGATIPSTGVDQFRVPQGAREMLERRLAGLRAPCRELLAHAALVGREFDVATLARVQGIAAPEVVALLDEALEARAVATAAALGRYHFTHALIAETLVADCPLGVRAAMHRRIAHALTETGGDPTELAFHFGQAAAIGEAEAAVHWGRVAGALCTSQLAYEEAIAHYRRALEALDLCSRPDDAERCELCLALGDAAFRAGDREEARARFFAAAAVARRLLNAGHPMAGTWLGRSAMGVGEIWGMVGVTDASVVSLLEESLAVAEPASAAEACLSARLAVALYWSEAVERRTQLIGRALEMARALAHPATSIYVLDAACFALWRADNPRERLELSEMHMRIAESVGDAAACGAARIWRIICNLELGNLPAVEHDAAVYAQLAEQWRQPHYRWYARVVQAMLALLAGRLEEGERVAFEALEIGQRAQGTNAVQFFGVQMLQLARLRGDLTALEEPVRATVRDFPALKAWRAVLATILVRTGRADQARAELEALAARDFADLPNDTTLLVNAALLIEVAAALGARREAELLYNLLRPYADRCLSIGNAAACFGSVEHFLGLAAAARGRDAEAIGHFEAALQRHRRLGAAPYVAESAVRLAQALIGARGASEQMRAAELIDEARASSERLGLRALAAETATLATELFSPTRSQVVNVTVDSLHATFRRNGEVWDVGSGMRMSSLRHGRGCEYLAALLARPGQQVHALELFEAVHDASVARPDSDAGEVLDAAARTAYRGRMRELTGELDEARAANDLGRIERLQDEIEFLARELAAGFGLGGRCRRAGSRSERARVSVTRAIRAALARIRVLDPPLAVHLTATVRTGTFCCYQPDPRVPTDWSL